MTPVIRKLFYFLKKTSIAVILLITLCHYALALSNNQAVHKKVKSSSLIMFIMHYYQNPRDETLLPTLKETLDNGCPEGFQAELFAHFYAAAIKNSLNKNQLIQKLEQLKPRYSTKKQKIIDSIIKQVKNFRSPPANSSDNFDFLWAEFFATGSQEPVEKIASYLKMTTYKQKIDIIYLATAEWSLASNADQSPQVKAILEDIYTSAKGIQKRRLKRILDDPAGVAARFNSSNLPHDTHSFNELKDMVW